MSPILIPARWCRLFLGIAWQAWGRILPFGVPLFLLVEVEKTVLRRRDSRSGQR